MIKAAINLTAGLVFILIFVSTFSAEAQTRSATITGKIVDGRSRLPLEFAIVKLLSLPDSAVMETALANKEGQFKITVQKQGNYLVQVSFIGFTTAIKKATISFEKAVIDLGTITLAEGIDLSAVTVTTNAMPLRIKKDTLEYNALAFKTAPNANTESMLKKIAGFEVDEAGNIKIHGQDLSKVTVEGKKFFGDNYKIATQNLPADAIAKIQVIDDKTDRAKETGIDDGTRQKTINLILKDDKKSGWFGSASAAGGTGDHYLGSASINHFNDKIQLNLLLMSNNINQTYSAGEVGSYSGNNFGKGAVSGMANGVAFGRVSQGLTKTNSGALNFSKDWGQNNRYQFRGYYIGSLVSGKMASESDIQNIQPGGDFFNNDKTNKLNDNQSHALELNLQARIDSLTTLSVSPSLSFDQTSANSNRQTSTVSEAGEPVNNGLQRMGNDMHTPSFYGTMTLRRALKQKKGTMALTLTRSYARGTGANENFNNAAFYTNGLVTSSQVIDQLQDLQNLNSVLNVKGLFSRSLSKDKKTLLVVNAGINTAVRNADQYTYDFNPITGLYELVVPELSSNYKNKVNQKEVELGLNKSTAKLTLSAYTNLQYITLHGNITGNAQFNQLTRNYLAVLPRVTLSYKTEDRRSYLLNISSSVNTPSVTDLQPVQNNNNPLYIRDGNPDLQPAKSYSAQLMYNFFNLKTSASVNYGISYSIYRDAFSTSNFFDNETGISYVKPLNVNGNYVLSLTSNFGKPLKSLKGVNFNYGLSASKRRSLNYVNGLKNNTESLSAAGNISLNYNYKESVNVSLYNRTSYTNSKNSVNAATDNNYFLFNNTASLNLEFAKKWRFIADLNHQAYAGSGAFNQSVLIVNAGIQRTLMPKDQLIFDFKGYDLFNQNSSITRLITDNRIEDMRVMNLRRYFLLKLTFKVNKMGPAAKKSILI